MLRWPRSASSSAGGFQVWRSLALKYNFTPRRAPTSAVNAGNRPQNAHPDGGLTGPTANLLSSTWSRESGRDVTTRARPSDSNSLASYRTSGDRGRVDNE